MKCLEVPPQQIKQFQWLWFWGLANGAVYDLAVNVVGEYVEAGVDIVHFAIAIILMHYAVQRRSRFARVLLIPFLVGTIVEVFSHGGYTANSPESGLAIVQLTLMTSAVWLLFTPAARCWYLPNAID